MYSFLFSTILSIAFLAGSCLAAPVRLVDEPPVSIKRLGPDVILVDFGRVAFGNVQLMPPVNAQHPVTVHFGEDLDGTGASTASRPAPCATRSPKPKPNGITPIVVAPPVDRAQHPGPFGKHAAGRPDTSGMGSRAAIPLG